MDGLKTIAHTENVHSVRGVHLFRCSDCEHLNTRTISLIASPSRVIAPTPSLRGGTTKQPRDNMGTVHLFGL